MALTLEAVINAARHRSPWFHKQRGTPDPVVGDYLADYQNELIATACLRDKHFLSQTATIALRFEGADPVTLAGAGADAGLPGAVTDNTIAAVAAAAARLVQVGFLAEDGATVLIEPTPATSGTTTSLTKTGAGRTVDGDIGKVIAITHGTGAGQARYILSNTATVWTVSTGSDTLEWATVPDATSLFTLVAPAYSAAGGADVVLAMPATDRRSGYVVRLDATGTPFIDLAAPIVTTLDAGVTLPSAVGITGGRIRTTDGATEPLDFVPRTRRDDPDCWPAVYVIGNTLYFCGRAADWQGIDALEIEYVPTTPAFTGLAEYFLLPDSARPVLVAKAAECLAARASELPDCPVKVGNYAAIAADAEERFLKALNLTRRARRVTFGGDSSYSE